FRIPTDDAFAVQHHYIFRSCAKGLVKTGTGDGRSSRSADYDLDLFYLFPGYYQGVQQGGGRDDGRTVLVIVHYGNIQFFLEPPFYFKGLGSLDIFQVDTSKGRGN